MNLTTQLNLLCKEELVREQRQIMMKQIPNFELIIEIFRSF